MLSEFILGLCIKLSTIWWKASVSFHACVFPTLQINQVMFILRGQEKIRRMEIFSSAGSEFISTFEGIILLIFEFEEYVTYNLSWSQLVFNVHCLDALIVKDLGWRVVLPAGRVGWHQSKEERDNSTQEIWRPLEWWNFLYYTDNVLYWQFLKYIEFVCCDLVIESL